MLNFKDFYDNEIYPAIKESSILSEWAHDFNKYSNFYTNLDKYFDCFTVFCILLFIICYVILQNFEDWKMCHTIIYYSIGIVSTFGIPLAWTISLSIKRQYAKQKKEKEKYYKHKLKDLGIYKKILQNLSCEGDYYNKPFPITLLKKSKLLKSLEKIVSIDDCIVGIYDDIRFSIYDCICIQQTMVPKGGAISYNLHNLIINFKNINKLPSQLITRENLHETNYKVLPDLFLKFSNNDIKLEIINDDVIICFHDDRDYFEFCDLSNNEIINYENLSMLSADIQNVIHIIDLMKISK